MGSVGLQHIKDTPKKKKAKKSKKHPCSSRPEENMCLRG